MSQHRVSDLVSYDSATNTSIRKSATPDIDTQIEEILRPLCSYESDDCTLCGHNQSYHYWNGGGRAENSGFDSCKAEGCGCDGVFDEKGYLIIQTTSQLDIEPYQKAHKAIKALLIQQKGGLDKPDVAQVGGNQVDKSCVDCGKSLIRCEECTRLWQT